MAYVSSMRIKTVSNILVAMGAVVGVATVAIIALDYSPTLTPEMVNLLFYKGLGAAAVGLIIVGTIIGRIGRDHRRDRNADPELLPPASATHIDVPSPNPIRDNIRQD